MKRRSFLSLILLAGAAPAIVRADSLMRIVPRETTILEPVINLSHLYPVPPRDYTIKGELVEVEPLWVDRLQLVFDVDGRYRAYGALNGVHQEIKDFTVNPETGIVTFDFQKGRTYSISYRR